MQNKCASTKKTCSPLLYIWTSIENENKEKEIEIFYIVVRKKKKETYVELRKTTSTPVFYPFTWRTNTIGREYVLPLQRSIYRSIKLIFASTAEVQSFH